MVQELEVKSLTDMNELRQILSRVRNTGAQFILKHNGQPEAALLSIADLALLQRMRTVKERAWDDFFENLSEVHALNAGYTATEVEADVDAAIRELRHPH